MKKLDDLLTWATLGLMCASGIVAVVAFVARLELCGRPGACSVHYNISAHHSVR